MKQFDDYIFKHISQEDIPMPKNYHAKLEETMNALPERAPGSAVIPFRRILSAAAAFVFVFLMLLPNASPAYAQALEDVPVIGALVEVFTIRNYFHSDDRSELDADVPQVVVPDAAQAQDQLNADVEALIQATVEKFQSDLEASGTSVHSVHVNYEVVTNTPQWFTLKIFVEEIAASGNVQLYYYHIDRVTGAYVTFDDLFTQEGYAAIEKELRLQMADNDNYDVTGAELLAPDQSFWFDDNGDLIIVYGEAEIAPASMGNPSFRIPAEIFSNYRK